MPSPECIATETQFFSQLGKIRRLRPHGLRAYPGRIMKKTNLRLRTDCCVLRWRLNEVVVKPLADLIHRQRLDNIEQGRRIFAKLREVDDMISIIARQLKRDADGDA